MSKKRRKTNVNVNQEINNVKEEPKMKKEETVENLNDIENLSDEELGVQPEEVDDEYEYDENGNRIKIVYVEVEKPSKIKAFINRHKKVLTGIGVGILTAGVGAAGAAIAYNVGKKTNGDDNCDIDGNYLKVTTDDPELIDKIGEDVMDSLPPLMDEMEF